MENWKRFLTESKEIDDFLKTLSDEQRVALLKALNAGDFKAEQPQAEPPKEEPEPRMSEEDFTMNKHRVSSLPSNGRREPVRAKGNTWTDEGESREIKTPEVQRTPRNRPPPKKKEVICNQCGKKFKVNANVV